MKTLFTFVLSSLLIVGTVSAQSGSRSPVINGGSGSRGIIQSAPIQSGPVGIQASPAPIQSAPPIQGAPAGAINSGSCSSCNGGAVASPAYSSGSVMSFSDSSLGGGDCGCGGGAAPIDSFSSFGGGGDCGCSGGGFDGGFVDDGGCGGGFDGGCGGHSGGGFFGGFWNRRPMFFGRRFGFGGGGCGCGF